MIESLVDTRLSSSLTTIYTAPRNRRVEVRLISLTNVSGSAVTVNLWLHRVGKDSRYLTPKDLQLAAGEMARDSGAICLSAGDRLTAQASGAVDAVVSGLVENTSGLPGK